MASQADIRAVDNAILSAPADVAVPSTLSWWDRLKESVVPESYGESVVNEIYSAENRGLRSDPTYDARSLGSPNVYVAAKGAIKDAATAAFGFSKTALIAIAIFLVVLVAVNAFIRR